MAPIGGPIGAGKRFFIANPNITDILGNTDLIERILLLYSVLNPRFPNSWVPDAWILEL